VQICCSLALHFFHVFFCFWSSLLSYCTFNSWLSLSLHVHIVMVIIAFSSCSYCYGHHCFLHIHLIQCHLLYIHLVLGLHCLIQDLKFFLGFKIMEGLMATLLLLWKK
jgi:hypothetical protein